MFFEVVTVSNNNLYWISNFIDITILIRVDILVILLKK